MFRKAKSENGSVTIEATISLSAFMFAIVTILTIVNICIVQAKIACAINATAREISQYSYLYSLTGLNQSEGKIEKSAEEQTKEVTNTLTNVNTLFNEIQNLGNTGNQTINNVDDIMDAWKGVEGSLEDIKGAGSAIESSIENIAKDPKSLLFGIVKLAGVKGFDLVKSRLIAAPLAKVMCQKHLVDTKDGDVNAYLKGLGVVPSAGGSYIEGLDFSKSSLFPYGSSEIRINVSYDVKVIALLPINITMHFDQSAVTNGWLAGEVSFKTAEQKKEQLAKDNETIWTNTPVNERADYIRHLGIMELESEGYEKTTGLTDVPLYKSDPSEFVMISSMNPLYSADGEPPRTLEDLDDDALQIQIERLAGKMKSTTDGLNTVKTKKKQDDGSTLNTEYDCSKARNTIMLVIPEDEGLKERIEDVIKKSNTRGVKIEVFPAHGNGARQTIVKEAGKEE